MTATLGIADLARETGLTPGTLRTWEHRYGFPRGERTESGRRRFTPADVDRVREVVAARERGLPLELAVRTVLGRHRARRSPTVFAALTGQVPGLQRARLSRGALVDLSQAIEDECLAHGDHPVVLGAFQQGRRFAPSARRWRELARTASWCVVVADFGGDVPDEPRLVLCDLPADAPMRREWTVVSLGDDYGAVLSAWEQPGEDHFEAVISTDPAAVQVAARVLVDVAREQGAEVPEAVRERIEVLPAPARGTSAADRLLVRAAARLDHRLGRASSVRAAGPGPA